MSGASVTSNATSRLSPERAKARSVWARPAVPYGKSTNGSDARSASPTSWAFLGQLAPLVAAGIGVGALGETLTLIQVAGLVLALAAVLAGQLPARTGRTALPVGSVTAARVEAVR